MGEPGTVRYKLILLALADDVPVEIRLRRVLKSLLRQYGFKCKSVKRVGNSSLEPRSRGLRGSTARGRGNGGAVESPRHRASCSAYFGEKGRTE